MNYGIICNIKGVNMNTVEEKKLNTVESVEISFNELISAIIELENFNTILTCSTFGIKIYDFQFTLKDSINKNPMYLNIESTVKNYAKLLHIKIK